MQYVSLVLETASGLRGGVIDSNPVQPPSSSPDPGCLSRLPCHVSSHVTVQPAPAYRGRSEPPCPPKALTSNPVLVLQNKLVRERPEVWRAGLRQLVPLAQQQRDDRMLRNPYLQMSAMLDAGLPDVAF